ncbi:hypothetical protein [Microbacterium murale]|uniref:Uncharacterized protein n=1 Tax=Microbacterium murale TaxID=1081040 RepID=A0ABU0P3D7_9MICO|nr:hypothetical protein [Microbacterium murale]MDQ0641850.1 hypothetical protein [Microbacterium murale]
MSTSDQQGKSPLTRKQMREIRLTGATPVISEEEAAAAAVEAQPAPAAPLPRPSQPVEVAPSPKPDADVDLEDAPLTRRQAREQERIRTASVPVITPEESEAAAADVAAEEELVSGVPSFAPHEADAGDDDDDDDDLGDEVVDIAPVSAAVVADSTGEVPLGADEPAAEASDEQTADDSAVEQNAEPAVDDDESAVEHDVDPISALGVDASNEEGIDDEESDALPVAEPVETGENHVVSPTFGKGLLADKSEVPSFAPSFDELITADSGGSQHLAPNTLIFTPSPGEGSLSGPVASTGEILVTGSYELPRGIGSQGHAHGAADGKESDAVLIDGELPPASSPTPIAASSAISTIKPAGEVIRPPAPEKGNKLMLILAITAGGLALALAVALIVAFTTNIFS